MADILGIFVTCLALAIICIRAIQLDRSQPWFQRVEFKETVRKAVCPGSWRN